MDPMGMIFPSKPPKNIGNHETIGDFPADSYALMWLCFGRCVPKKVICSNIEKWNT
jgi:hypothetical protein